MTQLIYFVGLVSFLFCDVKGHVRLTFPPARIYAFDFLNRLSSEPPCGFQAYLNAPRTRFVAGTKVRIRWHVGYPHKGGFQIQLIKKDPFIVLFSFTNEAFIFQNDSTRHFADVILPHEHTCDDCVIRLLRHASEWGSDFVFWSCADVIITSHPERNAGECGSVRKRRQADSNGVVTYPMGTDVGQDTSTGFDASNVNQDLLDDAIQMMSGTDTSATDDMSETSPDDTSGATTEAAVAESNPGISAAGSWSEVDSGINDQTSPTAREESASSGIQAATSCDPSTPLPPACYEMKCLNGGSCEGGDCKCRRLLSGDRCENADECWNNSDCSNNGECIDTRSTTYPRLVCYCKHGWFGRNCEKKSNVVLQQNYSSNPEYSTRIVRPDLYTLHWRFVDDEIEIAVEARTLSWVGIGWRPGNLMPYCKQFPQPLLQADDAMNADVPTGSFTSTKNPSADPEVQNEKKLRDRAKEECDIMALGGVGTVPDANQSPPPNATTSLHPMDCMDIVVASVKGYLHRVEDMHTRDRSTPRSDRFYSGADDITGADGSQIDGMTTIVFRKKMRTNHWTDHPITRDNMTVIWALGQHVDVPPAGIEPCAGNHSFYVHDELKYHGFGKDKRGVLDLNFHDSGKIDTDPVASETGEFKQPPDCNSDTDRFGCRLVVSWNYNEETDFINFTLKYPYQPDRWVALGFSENRLMPSSDVITAWISASGEAVVQDRWAEGYFVPRVELQNNVVLLSSSIVDSVAVLSICVQSYKQSIEQNIRFSATVQLEGVDFTPSLLQPDNQRFVELKKEMEELLQRSYNQLNLNYLRRAVKVEVIGFSPGSVKVHYIITATYDPTITQTFPSIQDNMTSALGNFVNDNGMHLAGSTYFVTVFGSMEGDQESLISFQSASGVQAQKALTYIACIVAVFALFQFSKFAHHKISKRTRSTKRQRIPEEATMEQVYKDINVNEIYDGIYELMKRRQNESTQALPLTTSSAAELKQIELMPIRRMSLAGKMDDVGSDGALFRRERSRDRRPSMHASHHPRPNSASSRRRKSQMRRRPSSAKAFEAKTHFEFFASEPKTSVNEKFSFLDHPAVNSPHHQNPTIVSNSQPFDANRNSSKTSHFQTEVEVHFPTVLPTPNLSNASLALITEPQGENFSVSISPHQQASPCGYHRPISPISNPSHVSLGPPNLSSFNANVVQNAATQNKPSPSQSNPEAFPVVENVNTLRPTTSWDSKPQPSAGITTFQNSNFEPCGTSLASPNAKDPVSSRTCQYSCALNAESAFAVRLPPPPRPELLAANPVVSLSSVGTRPADPIHANLNSGPLHIPAPLYLHSEPDAICLISPTSEASTSSSAFSDFQANPFVCETLEDQEGVRKFGFCDGSPTPNCSPPNACADFASTSGVRLSFESPNVKFAKEVEK